MVYNALKLFMEINPETFAAVQNHYKDQRKAEAEKAIARYDEWMQLREQAIANYNASGSTQPMPRSLTEPPSPRPQPYQEEEMADVSVDITANGFDASESFTLDRTMADDMVPVADPGLERPQAVSPVGLGLHGQSSPNSSPNGPHIRRKSVLPMDPAVRRDLEAHRSLEGGTTPPGPEPEQ